MKAFHIVVLGTDGRFGERIASGLAAGKPPTAGARACLDFFSPGEFLRALDGYAVATRLEVIG